MKSVLESKADITIDVLNPRRKCGQISDDGDGDLDEAEEIQPLKKRQMMTCTYNLK